MDQDFFFQSSNLLKRNHLKSSIVFIYVYLIGALQPPVDKQVENLCIL